MMQIEEYTEPLPEAENEVMMLFHGRSMRGIMKGRKNMTRRGIKPQPEPVDPERGLFRWEGHAEPEKPCYLALHARWHRGDVLWARETWKVSEVHPVEEGRVAVEVSYQVPAEHRGIWVEEGSAGHAMALHYAQKGGWQRSIHMPRWVCRQLLRVERVSVERVQDISVGDIEAEGVRVFQPAHTPTAEPRAPLLRARWEDLWNDTNSHRLEEFGWEANPWVWVIEFTRIPRGKVP